MNLLLRTLFWICLLWSCNKAEVDPDIFRIEIREGETRIITFMEQKLTISVLNANPRFMEGVFNEDDTGWVYSIFHPEIKVDQDTLRFSLTSVGDHLGKRFPHDWDTLMRKHNTIKRYGDFEIGISDVYHVPKSDQVPNEYFVVELLIR